MCVVTPSLSRFVAASLRSKQPLSVPAALSVYSDGQHSVLPDTQGYRADFTRWDKITTFFINTSSTSSSSSSSSSLSSLSQSSSSSIHHHHSYHHHQFIIIIITVIIIINSSSSQFSSSPIHHHHYHHYRVIITIITTGNWMRIISKSLSGLWLDSTLSASPTSAGEKMVLPPPI